MTITEITEKYNKERNNFNFPTISASERAIQDILRLNPDFLSLSEEDLIKHIAWEIYLLAFD
jgi:hypothetical protein